MMPRLPRHLSLRYVLVLAVLLGLLIPSWMVYQAEHQVIEQRLANELQQDRDRYADLLAVTLGESLWQFEPAFATPLVNKIMEDPQVTSVQVRRLPEGDIFIERSKPDTETDSLATREITYDGRRLGTVTIAVNARAAQSNMREARQQFLWRTMGIGAGAILFILIALHWRLSRPIDRLVLQAEALAAGNLQETQTWSRNDELGRVGRCMEKTRQALNTLVGELQEVNADLRAENMHRKTAETHLAQHAQELELRVAERTSELSTTNRTLSDTLEDLKKTQHDLVESKKLASMGRMVAGLAHELNTPIGTALTIGSTMGEQVRAMAQSVEAGQLKRSSLNEFLSDAADASDVLERLLKRSAGLVESFKKVSTHNNAATLTSFELADVVTLACNTFTQAQPDSAIALTIHVPPSIYMTSYPELLEQAIGIVLHNAQVHAFADQAHPHIELDATVADGMVAIAISDNGVGIAQDLHDRIFEPMFTVHMGRGGLGLGLSIAQSLITHQLGGAISVHDNPGGGARFVITLPLAVNDTGS